MATQNHTATFLSLRENFQRRVKAGIVKPSRPDGSRNNKAVHPSTTTEESDVEALLPSSETNKYVLPPVWVDAKDACEGMVVWLQESVQKLEEAHKDRLVVRFDDAVEGMHDKEIDNITRQITKRFRECEVKLKEIFSAKDTVKELGLSNEELSIRKNVQRSLAQRLQELSLQFRRSQKEYMSKLKLQRANGGGGLDNSDIMNSSSMSSSSAFLLSQEEVMEQGLLSDKIKERDVEITKIAKNIEELAVIFKELAVLVIEQGTILDRIDYNMDLVVERTEKGVKELELAEKYQKSNRAIWCIAILVALIFIFFIMIVAKLS